MSDVNDILKRANDALRRAVDNERQNKRFLETLATFMENMGPAVVSALQPTLDEIGKALRAQGDDIKQSIVGMKIESPVVNVPELKQPNVQVNMDQQSVVDSLGQLRQLLAEVKQAIESKETTVNIPAIPAPKVPRPNVEVSFPAKAITNELRAIKKAVSEQKTAFEYPEQPKYTRRTPMPALLVDLEGKPWEPMTNAFRTVTSTLKFSDNNGKERIVSEEFPLPVDATVSASITADYGSGEVGTNTLRVVTATDNVTSVNIVSGSSAGTQYSDAGTASTPTGTVAMGDTGEESSNVYALRTAGGTTDSSTLRVVFATDAVASVNIVSGSSAGTEYADGTKDSTPVGSLAMGYDGDESEFALRTHSGVVNSGTLRVVHASDVGVSVTATQTGTWNIATVTAVTDVTNSVRVSTLPETLQTQLDAIETAVEIMDDWDESDRAKVNLVVGQAGVAANAGEADARTLRTVFATDSVASVNIVSGSSAGTQYSDVGTASVPTGTVAMGDTGEESGNVFSLRTGAGVTDSSTLRILFAADAVASVNIVSGSSSGTQYTDGDKDTTPTGTVAMGSTSDDGANVYALRTASGPMDSSTLRVLFATDTVASVNIVSGSSSGTQYTNGDVDTTPTGTVAMGSTSDDGANVYALRTASGPMDSSTLRVLFATDSIASVNVVSGASNTQYAEDAAHASGDTGTMALFVRNSTNTTYTSADGDYSPAAVDGVGRMVMRPVQVRGLMATAYATVSNGTETTLLAGAASTFHDLVYLMATNNSDAAVTLDIRDATAAGIIATLNVPASSMAGFSPKVPIPQNVAADTWTVDMGDITGTTVYVSALFSKEV